MHMRAICCCGFDASGTYSKAKSTLANNTRSRYVATSIHVAATADRPPGNLGTSGQHFVPPVSPSLDPAIFGEVEPRDTVRMLGVKAMAVVRQQALAAQHGSRQIHSDPTVPAPEKHRRADAVATAAIMPALEPLEKARRTFEKSISELHAMLAGPP
jgi:hypothetical protein